MPVPDYLSRLQALIALYPPTIECEFAADLTVAELAAEVGPRRLMMVERSSIDGSIFLTSHDGVEAALDYSGEQDCPEDWTPVELVDLDDGTRTAIMRTYGCEEDTINNPLPDLATVAARQDCPHCGHELDIAEDSADCEECGRNIWRQPSEAEPEARP